ncbi:hypothetical protein N7474_001873 [Penicillium riverlandense]|uniref:uncharacterized protein n=1 Tax=Penicillium riverlandense TaxID=1903569 RepID=UPI0025467F64|nr:uncharacterized protein N7474_001873 [Penicillium riverlandense]KAJ5833562.1 hypothetical protein N7474_001873 [Penicillium riverlandense]
MTSADSETQPGQEQHVPLYRGSCHCGFVTYEARINFKEPTAEASDGVLCRCNCSYCLKAGLLITEPLKDSFRLLTPGNGDDGKPKLPVYKFGSGAVSHLFCPHCGVTCHYYGSYLTDEGETVPFTRLNAQTVDGRVDGMQMESLKQIKPKYWDGKSNGWHKGTSEEPWDGGVW